MPPLTENTFTFESMGLAPETFAVVRFTGEEALSTLYRFDLLLAAQRADLDLAAVLQQPATFTIKGPLTGGADLPYHGILANFEQLHQAGQYYFYRAELRPRLWGLTLTRHNQVFLDQTIAQVMAQVLHDGGLELGLDVELRRMTKYPAWDYVCQYGESHLAFFSRWLEWAGAYYWFEQGAQAEKLIVTDNLMAHTPMPGKATVRYSPISGLDAAGAGQIVAAFSLQQRPVPHNVLLKDYNYMKPHLDLQAQAEVQQQGRGEVYLYAEHFLDAAVGARLATVRADELRCRERVGEGTSQVPTLSPGYLFTLAGHFRDDFNQTYLTTSVRHEGRQPGYLHGGLGVQDPAEGDRLFYRNTFQCIPAATQFRPGRVTPRPRIHGTIPARIDAASSGQYPQLDQYGRYKVILPFDLSGRGGGQASAWLRMATPYAGSNHGMNFPLNKDTEVALSFFDGDPDRPYILAAMVNPSTPSVVNDQSQTQCRITTAGQNRLHFSDEQGKEYIQLTTPNGNVALKIGYHGSDGAGGANQAGATAGAATGSSYQSKNAMYQSPLGGNVRGQRVPFAAPTPLDTASLALTHEGYGGRHRAPFAGGVIPRPPSATPPSATPPSPFGANNSTSTYVPPPPVQISWQGTGSYVLECGGFAESIFGDQTTTVVGSTNTWVGGLYSTVVGGVNATLTLGANTQYTLGGVVAFNAPDKLECSGTKNSFSSLENKLHGEIAVVATAVSNVEGEANKISGINTRLMTAEQTIAGTRTEVTEMAEHFRTEVTELTETISETYATKVALTATEEKVRGKLSEVSSSVNKVSEEVTRLQGEVSEIDTACNRVATEVSEVATNVSVISTVIEMM
ncbi:type VI secretion system tip protein TssI/VgrG [uncultured Thiodictyon sp.]|uniref:type VI secretion system Vgr family protein n=1 Tax=uncultured Thiodictyon sp. TaxID=1846217 RepID=UPI0025EB9F02|nr:type VI secretion system tip protein TssI/VgrG [uncultured Thiodictyon sp.]